MFSKIIIIFGLVLPSLYGKPTTCRRSFPGQVDQVGSVPGLHFSIGDHYSGYLESINKNQLHYWFFESQSPTPEKDPVALWLNGGPGCSSLIGAFTELGPIRMNANGSLTPNPFSWTQRANVLFLETPAGAGFSYRPGATLPYRTNDDETVQVNIFE